MWVLTIKGYICKQICEVLPQNVFKFLKTVEEDERVTTDLLKIEDGIMIITKRW